MEPLVQQAAALPFRNGQLCLVTSRSRRRWVIPKGAVESFQTPPEAAHAEAWEEAGLLGTLAPEPLGSYDYFKEGIPHRAVVYALEVHTERNVWPERMERTREWVSPDVAVNRLEEPQLKEIVAEFFRRG